MGRLSSRTFAVALAVFVVGSGAMLAAGTLSGPTQSTAVTTPDTTATPASAMADHDQQMMDDGSMTAAERLDCTNGTSPAVVACGYNPGPTAVSLSDQETWGGSVNVEAAELDSGGFVAVHRVSFVDGQFTESVVGVSEKLDSGLHRNVEVDLDRPLPRNEDHRLIAVAYHDSDDDGMYDFVSSDGAMDRPYTNTYTMAAGNVTDEAGDVIGDDGSVTVMTPPTIVGDEAAKNADDDAMLEDIDGDGTADMFDAVAYYNNRNTDAIESNPALFDFNGDGESGTIFDAIALFNDVQS